MVMFMKEMREVTGDRGSFRGALVQAVITVAITGILVPATDGSIWQSTTTSTMLFVVFPSTLAASMAADSFAGESERGTLETLLATPLTDGGIFLGKVGSAAFFAVLVSLISLSTGLMVARMRGLTPDHFPVDVVMGVLAGICAGALLIAGLVASISLKIKVARSAQQVGSFLSFALAFAAIYCLRRLVPVIDWRVVVRSIGVVYGMATCSILLGLRLFRRDRFFDER